MTDDDSDIRPFPIQADHPSLHPYVAHPASTIPWWLAELVYKEYAKRYGTQQSMERLAERGGFGRVEVVVLIRRVDFSSETMSGICKELGSG